MMIYEYIIYHIRLADGSFEAVKPVITGGERISRFRAEDIVSSGIEKQKRSLPYNIKETFIHV